MTDNISKLTIQQIKKLIQKNPSHSELWSQLDQDPRQGVKKLIRQHQRQRQRQHYLQYDFERRLSFERPFWQHQQLVAGVDEVGRGPLAGPVVAAAVVLPADVQILEINDSKKLSTSKRRQLYEKILTIALDVSVGVGSRQLIDKLDIYHATEVTMAKAVNQLNVPIEHLLVDAMHIPVSYSQTKIIKGDAQSVSIGAASIIAKVYRDELMQTYAQIYPYYGFEKNAGYGTKDHLLGMQHWGICPLHRHSFAPVKKYL